MRCKIINNNTKKTNFKNHDIEKKARFIDDRLIGVMDINDPSVGYALIGSPSCGDAISLYIKVQNDIIVDAKIKVFGCASAMASVELLAKKIIGNSLDDVKKIKDIELAKELDLLPVKFHCSVLAEAAIDAAIQNYQNKLISKL